MDGGDVLWSRKGVDGNNNTYCRWYILLFIISVLLCCWLWFDAYVTVEGCFED